MVAATGGTRALTLEDVRAATGGKLVGSIGADWKLTRLTTDSRNVRVGDLFVALRGDRFDGNDFLDEAIAQGASVVVCARSRSLDRRNVAFVEVDDTLRALGEIAAVHRRRYAIPIVAITGSNGKTTTKELLAAILNAAFGREAVLATKGNLNNLIGLPLTAVQLGPHHRVAVLEMGMNAPGEIARLTEIAQPTHGLITCIGSAHLEGLGSIEGVAAAKGELFAGMDASATAVVNLDDFRVVGAAERLRGRRRVGYGTGGVVFAENVRTDSLASASFDLHYGDETLPIALGLAGPHNVQNAVAAAACAYALGIEAPVVAEGLAGAEPPPMRVAVEELANGVRLVNDCYNANPDSMRAAFETLRSVGEGRPIVALGEMLELGPRAAELHAQTGRDVGALSPVLVCAMGSHAQAVCAGAREAGVAEDSLFASTSHEGVVERIGRVWRRGDAVLVKGSRGARMELVVEGLKRLAGS